MLRGPQIRLHCIHSHIYIGRTGKMTLEPRSDSASEKFKKYLMNIDKAWTLRMHKLTALGAAYPVLSGRLRSSLKKYNLFKVVSWMLKERKK